MAGIGIALSVLAAWADDADLARKRANPLAYLTTLTLQFNDDCCFGTLTKPRYLLSTQFVKPVSINDDWYVLSRTVLPLMALDEANPRGGNHFGFGDTLESLFLSPKYVDGIAWGIGPALLFPTATDTLFGTEKYAAGPTITLVLQNHNWTYALLSHHLWSYAGSSDRPEVNLTYTQAGIAYTFPDTFAVGLGTETAYDWVTEQWSVPIVFGASKIFHLGAQPVSAGLSAKYYVATPTDGPRWAGRITVVFLFPK